MAKEQKFFCEFCKSQVPRDAGSCAVCGSKFSAVRCPKCGGAGSASAFSDGCPFCGYASRKSSEVVADKPRKPAIILDKPQKTKPSFTWLFYAALIAVFACLGVVLLLL
jgi:predicted nucleic acid-binding Zn ribbon protein